MIPIGRGAGAGPDDAAAEMFRRGWVAGYAAARAEVVAEIREALGKTLLNFGYDLPYARSATITAAVLALLPPTEPK